MEPDGFPSHFSHPPPVRTSSGGEPVVKIVGFDTSPASVIRFDEEAETPSPGWQRQHQVSPLGRALTQDRLAPPRLTINTKRDAKALQLSRLKKSKSHADLRVDRSAQAQAIPGPPTQPSSPQTSHSQGSSSGPLNIPFGLSRARTCPDEPSPDEYIQTSMLSAASSLASHHRALSPSHRSCSTRDLFEAQADAVTAQAQVQGLHSALKREHEEVVRLREQLSLVTAERDRLLQELREASTPRVFDMDDALLSAPFGTLRLH